MMARLVYWCGLVIAFLCGMVAVTILAAIGINHLPDSEAWTAVLFAGMGTVPWIVSHSAAKRM
jgi:hypothetical protein